MQKGFLIAEDCLPAVAHYQDALIAATPWALQSRAQFLNLIFANSRHFVKVNFYGFPCSGYF